MAINLAVTGHMNLTDATQKLIADELRRLLSSYPTSRLVGISCIARGADTIFAETILELGAQLDIILPSRTYREQKVKNDLRPTFDRLIEAARNVLVMPFDQPGRDAYEAANTALLQRCDELIAVWDGNSPADKGGTAAVVHQARAAAKPVHVIWPPGSRRT